MLNEIIGNECPKTIIGNEKRIPKHLINVFRNPKPGAAEYSPNFDSSRKKFPAYSMSKSLRDIHE